MFKDRNVMDTVKSSAKRLLLPYIVFLMFGLLIEAYFNTLHDVPLTFAAFLKTRLLEIVDKSTFEVVGPCWFLLSLFVVRVVFQMCVKLRISPILLAAFSLVVAYLVFYCSVLHDYSYSLQWGNGYCWNLHIPFYFGNMALGLMCYSLGYFLRDKQYCKWILSGAFLLFIAKYFVWAELDFRANNPWGTNYWLAALYGISGCIVFNNLFRRIANARITVLTNVGENSMIYYLVHWPVMYFITQRFYGSVFSMSPNIRFIVLSCMLVIVLWISGIIFRNKKISFLFGM